MQHLQVTPGCLIFAEPMPSEIGGFNERLFAPRTPISDMPCGAWPARRGLATVILRKHPPITSSRKLRLYEVRDPRPASPFSALATRNAAEQKRSSNLLRWPKMTSRGEFAPASWSAVTESAESPLWLRHFRTLRASKTALVADPKRRLHRLRRRSPRPGGFPRRRWQKCQLPRCILFRRR